MDKHVYQPHWQNLTNSTEHVASLPIEVKIPLGFLLIIIVLLTIGGNILVLLAVCVNKQLRNTTNFFVVSLASADLLLGLLVLPFSTVLQLEKRWLFGKEFCDVWASVDVLCCTASIFSLCAISVDRYIGVTRPLQHRTIMTAKRTVRIIIGIWILSFAISLGPLIGWREEHDDDQACYVTTKPGFVIFSTLCSFYIPATILLFIYLRIYREAILQVEFLKRGFKEAKTMTGNDHPRTILRAVTKRSLLSQTSAISRPTKEPLLNKRNTTSSHEMNPADEMFCQRAAVGSNKLKRLGQQHSVGSRISKFNKEKKAAKTLGIVVGVFLTCWFPFFIILPIDSLCTQCHVPTTLFDIVFWLGYCNSLLNPIIYATWNRDFKETFVRVLKGELMRQKHHVVSYLAHMSVQHMAPAAANQRTILLPNSTSAETEPCDV
ncbi:alpha-1A adrenergic receptor-like [Watersipora subatra]|uniref:alpha-1A adrenergic receptor-like n=1 Tax=Watersipora subatra TaxID=2589382 RepID=UPI00355B3498